MKASIPKLEARKSVEFRKKEISPGEFKAKSLKIMDRLSELDDFIYAEKIFAYLTSNYGDIDMKKIINLADGRGKSVFLPKFNKASKSLQRFQFTKYDELVKNEIGFYEPRIGIDEDMSDIDLILVPCIAVSFLGQRVGYGTGYYDKLLRKTYSPKYVLAFEFQVFHAIETEHFDVRVDKIITERRVIDTRNN